MLQIKLKTDELLRSVVHVEVHYPSALLLVSVVDRQLKLEVLQSVKAFIFKLLEFQLFIILLLRVFDYLLLPVATIANVHAITCILGQLGRPVQNCDWLL